MRLILSGKFDGTPWLLTASELADDEGFVPYAFQGKEDSERHQLNTEVLAWGRHQQTRVYNRIVTTEATGWEFFTEQRVAVMHFALIMAKRFGTELILADELDKLLRGA